MRPRLLPAENPENGEPEGGRGEITRLGLRVVERRLVKASLSFRRAWHSDESEKREFLKLPSDRSSQQVRFCDRQSRGDCLRRSSRGEISYRDARTCTIRWNLNGDSFQRGRVNSTTRRGKENDLRARRSIPNCFGSRDRAGRKVTFARSKAALKEVACKLRGLRAFTSSL